MINIILGGKSNALSIARSLAGLDGERHVLTTTRSGICRSSRFVDYYGCFACSADVLEALAKYDVAAVKILYPTSDLWARFISDNEMQLRSMGFLFLTVAAERMSLMLDKFLLYKAFRDIVPMPETALASCREEFTEGKAFIVKPRWSFSGDTLIDKGFRGELEVGSDFVVQEKLSMDVRNHYSFSGLAKDGRVVFGGLTNKLLEHPAPGGTATLVVSSGVDSAWYDQALRIVKDVVSAIGYGGVFEVELILHEGKLWFLEMNPRFWLQHEIFSLMGVNIAQAYMALCLGNPVGEPLKGKHDGLVWVHEGFWVSLLTNRYGFFDVARSLCCGKKVFAHWRISDPRPFFVFLCEMICKRS